ncbi:MAG: tetratricopeptide repeat protein [Candidatus Omnitrophota bacterium]
MSKHNIKSGGFVSRGLKFYSSTPLAIIFIFFLGFLIYSNTFQSPFQFDEELFILHNSAIQNLWNIKDIWNFAPTRFITYLSFALNYHFHQLHVSGYHLVNLVIHISTAILVRWFILLTFSTPVMANQKNYREHDLIALFGGLLFVTHPVQTSAVTYIYQRAASLAAFFYLASLCLYIKARLLKNETSKKTGGWKRYYGGSLLTAVLAIFTKEITITLPLMIMLYEVIFLKEGKKSYWKYPVPFFMTIPLMFFAKSLNSINFGIRSFTRETITIARSQYLLTQFRVIITYLRLLLIPVNQNIDYDYPTAKTLFTLPVFASLLLLLLILALGISLFRKNRLISFSIFWFFLALALESSIIPIKDVIFEHRLYLPMVGYCIFLPTTLYYLFGEKRLRTVVTILIIMVSGYSALAYARNRVWKDKLTLWNDTVQKSPHKARPYNNRGVAYLNKGAFDKALADFNQAISINPNYAEVYNNRGEAYWNKGDSDKAIADYNQALSINPNYFNAYNNRGEAYWNKGDSDKAIADYNQAISLNPNFDNAYKNRGIAYGSKGDYDKALADFNQAISINPNYADAYNNRGVAYSNKGASDKALADFNQAISLNPNYADAYYNRGMVYWNKSDSDKAIVDFDQAISLNPNYADAYFNRGVAYFIGKNYDKSWEDVHKVQSLGFHINPAFIEELRKASGRNK